MKNSKILSIVISSILSIILCFITSKIATLNTLIIVPAILLYFILIFNIIYPILNVKNQPFNKVIICEILSSFLSLIATFSLLLLFFGIIEQIKNIMCVIFIISVILSTIFDIIYLILSAKMKNNEND